MRHRLELGDFAIVLPVGLSAGDYFAERPNAGRMRTMPASR
jgi:hypothetical protein